MYCLDIMKDSLMTTKFLPSENVEAEYDISTLSALQDPVYIVGWWCCVEAGDSDDGEGAWCLVREPGISVAEYRVSTHIPGVQRYHHLTSSSHLSSPPLILIWTTSANTHQLAGVGSIATFDKSKALNHGIIPCAKCDPFQQRFFS